MRPPRIIARRYSAPVRRKCQIRDLVWAVRRQWKQPFDVQPWGLQIVPLQHHGVLVLRTIVARIVERDLRQNGRREDLGHLADEVLSWHARDAGDRGERLTAPQSQRLRLYPRIIQVAEHHLGAVGEVVVHADHFLPKVLRNGEVLLIIQETGRVRQREEVPQQQLRVTVDPGRRDTIARERLVGEGIQRRPSDPRRFLRVVAVTHCLRRRRGPHNLCGPPLAPLLGEEKECFVPLGVVYLRDHHRPANPVAEVVQPQRRFGGGEKVARVEGVVAYVFICGAVELLRPSACYRQHVRAARCAVLRAVIARQDLDFGDRLHTGIRH